MIRLGIGVYSGKNFQAVKFFSIPAKTKRIEDFDESTVTGVFRPFLREKISEKLLTKP